MPNRPRYLILLEALSLKREDGSVDAPAHVRLKQFLKEAGRYWRFKAIKAVEVRPGESIGQPQAIKRE